MSFGNFDIIENKIKNSNLAKDLPFGLSFHDSEITKMQIENGHLVIHLKYGYETPFVAKMLFKNAIFKEFELDVNDHAPTIVFPFEAEEKNGKFEVNVEFCVSAFSKLSFICDEICLEQVTLLKAEK